MSKDYDPTKHNRKSIRLKTHDYSSAGFYFVTICIKNQVCLLGKIENNKMILNEPGRMVEKEWFKLADRFLNIKLHEHIIMPNHFHGIIEILDTWKRHDGKEILVKDEEMILTEKLLASGVGQPQGIAPTGIENVGNTVQKKTLGNIIGAFTSITTVKYIRGVKDANWKRFNGKLWQRNYWEHIIRHGRSYANISNYIITNAENWEKDKFYTKEGE